MGKPAVRNRTDKKAGKKLDVKASRTRPISGAGPVLVLRFVGVFMCGVGNGGDPTGSFTPRHYSGVL
jgi:hypothetical protein